MAADNTVYPGIEFAIGYLNLEPSVADTLRAAARANRSALQQHVDRRLATLEFMLGEIVYLHSDGTVRVSWKPDVDLIDKVPGIRGIAKPVVPLSEHLRG